MYRKPQDIITGLLHEDLGIDIRTEPEDTDLGVKIQGDIAVDIVPAPIGVKINNPNKRKIQLMINK